MDVAASEFYKTDVAKYDLDFKNPNSDPSKWLTGEVFKKYYCLLLAIWIWDLSKNFIHSILTFYLYYPKYYQNYWITL